jgi:hypothetical protein
MRGRLRLSRLGLIALRLRLGRLGLLQRTLTTIAPFVVVSISSETTMRANGLIILCSLLSHHDIISRCLCLLRKRLLVRCKVRRRSWRVSRIERFETSRAIQVNNRIGCRTRQASLHLCSPTKRRVVAIRCRDTKACTRSWCGESRLPRSLSTPSLDEGGAEGGRPMGSGRRRMLRRGAR